MSVTAAVALALGVTAAVTAPAADAGTLTVSPTGTFKVTYRGNGHGHGMSQYGARGAAIAGLTYQQILAFYYPGTTLSTLPTGSLIRVRLSATAATLTVSAVSHTVVTGVTGELPTTGISRYRLIAAGTGLNLQKIGTAAGSVWTNVKTGLPSGTEFHRTNWSWLHRFNTDGSSTDYYGYLGAVRLGTGLYTVNRVSLDRYTQGVVPTEMPTSWQPAAVNSQAVAARTYGAFNVAASAPGDPYDICDTTQCQVYGGHARYDKAGNLLAGDYPPAAAATANKVLRYQGAVIFAQFSASNGGWTVAGGPPYLPAKADPYDNAASGDPFINATTIVKVPDVAKAFGLKTVTQIVIDQRDGNGVWGGRTISGHVHGTDSANQPKTVNATGSDFAKAFGINTTWLTCSSASP